MKKNIIPVLVATILLFSANTFASTVHGTLMVVKGSVVIEAAKDKKSTKARIGSKIFQGDIIVTGKDSRAKIVMIDKNVINLSPDSRFQLEKYVYKPETNEKGALLNVIYGKVRTTVNQKYDGDKNKFQVKTKSSVAGVRGTDFLVQFNSSTNTTRVVTFEGRVEVGSGLDTAGRIMGAVTVDPGQFTVAAIDIPPSAPAEVPKGELTNLNEQSVADSAPAPRAQERQPSQEDGKQQDGKKEESRSPNAVGPNQGPVGGGAGAVLDNMGEDISSSVVGGFNPPVPTGPQSPGNFCPPGGCTNPVGVVDPSLLQGTSNVIIQITPGP